MNASASTQFFTYFDWTATFLWAASGALLAARRGYDILGIAIIALVSACGGGLLRDGIFLQNGPPLVVRSPVYLGLVGIATLAVVIFGRHLRGSRSFYRVVTIVNAIGLGAYAVVGMNLAIAANLPVFGVIFVGTVNAVGGSVLRDILMGDLPPMLFRPSVLLGLVSLAGCVPFRDLHPLRHRQGVRRTLDRRSRLFAAPAGAALQRQHQTPHRIRGRLAPGGQRPDEALVTPIRRTRPICCACSRTSPCRHRRAPIRHRR